MKKKILVIVNPCAGKGKVSKYVPEICDNLEKQGNEIDVIYTSPKENGETIIKNYQKYINLVIVCGGDGTLSEVINGIVKTNKKVDVTFIPFGTTNDYAKTVNIPINKYKLSKEVGNYEEMRVDIGDFNKKYFYYVAAFGLFTSVSYTTKQESKNKFGRLAYFAKALEELKKIPTYRVSILADNEIIKDKFIYGSVTNSTSIAGFKWFKENEVSVNDGKFEVVLIKKPRNLKDGLAIIKAILTQKYNQRNVISFKAKNLKFDFDEEVSWTLDGEFGEKTKETIILNKKNKIDLMLPVQSVEKMQKGIAKSAKM